MEESQKGTAPNSSKKTTSASLEDDFGKDFLTSWKSTKFGDVAMDFDVETSEGKGKGKKFNFGKLDDFDLDADFGKLPSFKMDMSDLDFSSPSKKNTVKPSTEKSKDSLPGKDKEKESFSFSFDFDDLGKFDLDSHLSIKEKEASKAQPTSSVDLSFNKTHKEKTYTEIVDISKINSTKAPSKPETSSSTSRPPSTEQHTSKQPSCNVSNGSDQSNMRQFNIPSISGKSKYKEAPAAQSYSLKSISENKRDSSAQSLESYSQLKRSASPVISSNNLDNVSGFRSSEGGVNKEKGGATISVQKESEKNSVGVKEAVVEKGLNSTATTSAIQRKLNIVDAHAKSSLLTSPEKASRIGESVLTGDGNPETANRTFSTLKNTNRGFLANNASSRTEKETLVSNPSNTLHIKTNQTSSSATPERDLTSEKLRELNKAPSQLAPSVLPNLGSKEKPAFLSPPLKRKVAEESVPPVTPLKRISSSLTQTRKSPMVALKAIYNFPLESRKSPETDLKSGPEVVTGSESGEALRDNQRSPNVAPKTVLGIADFEIPVLVLENNGNVEKAEAISKELGDISSMLEKEQEKAKELLVRAIVSNNKLLMLDHPMYAEKLSALERFASTLRVRHF